MWFGGSRGSLFWICLESSLVIQVLPSAECTKSARINSASDFFKETVWNASAILRNDHASFQLSAKTPIHLCHLALFFMLYLFNLKDPGLGRVSLSDCNEFWGSKLPPDFSTANEPGKYESNVRLSGWVHESTAAEHALYSTLSSVMLMSFKGIKM